MNEETSKTYVFGNEGATVPAWLAYNNGWNNNGFGLNGGWGTGILGFLLGTLFNGGWNNGFGGFGNNNAAAGYLGNQINNDNNTDLILNAINGTDADVRLLATTLNADVNEVKSSINTIQNAVQSVGSQVGMTGLQVINAIQSGDAALTSALQNCCCENRLLTTQQGYEAQIRTLEQTNTLGAQADRNANDIIRAINAQTVEMDNQFCAARERDMQTKIDTQADIITQLRGQIDNANQTAAITGYVNSLIAPIQAKVTEIADKQLPTVPVQWPQIQAVNMTPYAGNYYGGGFYGNGWNNGIAF